MMKVELYTQPECPPCTIVKQFLQHHGVSYEEFDVKKDTIARNRMVHEYDSFSTPTVVVDSIVVAGFNIEKLQELLGIKE
ncbi:glutaredoxin domain-containing protein [Priestia taiwanensis]|nr:glutaredoxin domain-containing protein [Priestia taiwanensis]